MPNENENTFYNVMPEAHAGNMHTPSAASTASATPAPNPRKVNASAAGQVFNTPPAAKKVTMDGAGKPSFIKRKAVMIPAAVFVLAAVGFAVWWFLVRDTTSDDLLVVNEPPVNNETPDTGTTTPADWLARYFGSETCTIETQCGDSADPDRDGLTNKEEFETGTDPNNPDGDTDGIADGDEVHIFGSDPIIAKTFRDGQFNDADFVKGGFDIRTDTKYTDQQYLDIKAKIKERGLHQPTLTTIGTLALTMYDFTDPNATGLEGLNLDMSPQAKLDRDTQRQSTIKKIGSALIKYKNNKNSFPLGNNFVQMSDEIGPFNTVATNYNDPINKAQYVYGYEASATGGDFTLTYFSETQNQLIKYTAKNAEETEAKEGSQVNNDKRMMDLENIRTALMIYSTSNSDSNSTQLYVFPTKEQYPSVLIPRYLTEVPKDPKGNDYSYEVTQTYDGFILRAPFDNPPAGVTGYMCDQNECKNY